MKRYISFLALIFFSIGWAQAQPACSKQDGCFTFNFFGAEELPNGNYEVIFTIENNCPDPFRYAIFDFGYKPQAQPTASPGMKLSTSPQGKIAGNNSTTAIYFEADDSNASPMAATRTSSHTFEFTPEEFSKLVDVEITVVAGNSAGSVTFNFEACGVVIPPPIPDPFCVIDLVDESGNGFLFGFIDATANANNTTTVRFGIQNNTSANVQQITIEVPEAPQPIEVETNAAGIYSYIYSYEVTIEESEGLIIFDPTNLDNDYVDGEIDVFSFTIPTELYDVNPFFLLSVATSDGNFGTTGFNTRDCTDQPINPLPVELSSFEGKVTESGITLEWTTASEQDNDRFEIERSQDGQRFATIGTVKGAGNSSTSLRYSYTDAAAESGTNYYRIKQVDFDGTSEISKVIAITNKLFTSSTNALEVYPNPARGDYVVISLEDKGADAVLQITDMNGRIVHNQLLQAGSNQLELSLPTLKIAKGMYYIKLQQGSVNQTKKLVVQ